MGSELNFEIYKTKEKTPKYYVRILVSNILLLIDKRKQYWHKQMTYFDSHMEKH